MLNHGALDPEWVYCGVGEAILCCKLLSLCINSFMMTDLYQMELALLSANINVSINKSYKKNKY